MGFGDDQDMNGGPWVDVMKGQQVFVFIDFFARDLPVYDFAKDTVGVTGVCVVLRGVGCAHGL